jgi:hypothetical protein
MLPQEMVDLFAELAQPRLLELLKLKVPHVYDPAPGRPPARVLAEGHDIALDKLKKTTQPYKNIERFVSSERVMNYIIDPGLIPIVKAILLDVRGRRLLATRKLAPLKGEAEGAMAHLSGFGMRIVLHADPNTGEWQVTWECFYGVA